MSDLDKKIESVLFFKGEPVKLKKLADILGENETSVKEALEALEQKLQGRGVCLVHKEDEVMLGTAPETSELIEKITKEELSRDLGKAGLETLSIILYKGPIRRSEVDYIRGVNSQFIVRNLLVRGLVEKVDDPSDKRTFMYKPTFQLLSHLGITKIEDLPEFAKVKEEIEAFESSSKKEAEESQQINNDIANENESHE